MEKNRYLIYSLLITACVIQLSCAMARQIWAPKDIQSKRVNAPTLEKKVLVVSSSSEFKDAIVEKIRDSFKDKSIYLYITGINQLEKEKGFDYNSIIIIDTCIAWDIDPKVKAFIKQNKDRGNIILLATSGKGNWLPDMKEQNVDAISSASVMANKDEIAQEIITRIQSVLDKG